MGRFRPHFRQVLTFLLVALAGCASVQSPEGGPKDEAGPKLVEVVPPNESVNLSRREIVFTFDEYLKTADLSASLFVSPLIEPAPEAWAQNRKVHVKLPDSLREATTYVITLYEGVKDDHEGNPLSAPVRYAFSTGGALDSGRVAGRVTDALADKPASGWLVALFDSPADSGFYRQKPAYATACDAGGSFELSYLKAGRYRILAFKDADRNYQLNLPTEGVATATSDVIDVDPTTADSAALALKMRAFQPDEAAPKLKNIFRPNPFSLLLEFDETVEAGLILQTESRSDTLRQHPNGKTNCLLAAWPDSAGRDSIDLQLTAVIDTAGNRSDSLYRKKWPRPLLDSTFSITRLDTVKGVRRRAWMSDAPLDSASLARALSLLTPDSLPVRYRLTFEPPFRFAIELGPLPDTVSQVRMRLDSALVSAQGLRLKSPFSDSWDVQELPRTGSIAGRWAGDTTVPVVIELYNFNNKEIRRTREAVFRFDDLPPAPYQFRVLFDGDGNGRWTTGRLAPRRPPEMWYVFPDLITLRPGWEVDNVIIHWPPKAQEAEKPENSAEGEKEKPKEDNEKERR